MAKTYSFSELNAEMSKNSEYGGLIETSAVSDIDHYISTGNYNLNACLTGSLFGGYPNNRSVSIVGPSGCLQKNETIRIYKLKNSNGIINRKINEER